MLRLLPRTTTEPTSADGLAEPVGDEHSGALVQLPITQISEPDGERQIRQHYDAAGLEDLAVSLRSHGLLHPIGVRPIAADRYELVYGSRRLRAAKLAGWTTIAATIRLDIASSDADALAIGLVENLQRRQLSGAERARALRALDDLYVPGALNHPGEPRGTRRPGSQSDLARRLGVTQTTVWRWLGIARSPELLAAVEAEQLDMNRAVRIAEAPPQHVAALLAEALAQQLGPQAIRERVRELRRGLPNASATTRHLRRALAALEQVQRVDSEVEVELVDQVWRHASRIHRLEPRPVRP